MTAKEQKMATQDTMPATEPAEPITPPAVKKTVQTLMEGAKAKGASSAEAAAAAMTLAAELGQACRK